MFSPTCDRVMQSYGVHAFETLHLYMMVKADYQLI